MESYILLYIIYFVSHYIGVNHPHCMYFFTGAQYSIVPACHNSFIYSIINVNWGCFQFGAIMNIMILYTFIYIPFGEHVCTFLLLFAQKLNSWIIVNICILNIGNSKQLYQFTLKIVAIYTLLSIHGFHSHIITTSYCPSFLLAIRVGIYWYFIVVLILIS